MRSKIKITIILLTAVFIACLHPLSAQESTIAKGLGLYVFPSNDQDAEQQEQDEIACYKWGKEQTGVDPIKSCVGQDLNS